MGFIILSIEEPHMMVKGKSKGKKKRKRFCLLSKRLILKLVYVCRSFLVGTGDGDRRVDGEGRGEG